MKLRLPNLVISLLLTGAALLLSGLVTAVFIWPLFHRIDLFPVSYLLHPSLFEAALPISLAIPLIDAVLVWLWGSLLLSRVLRGVVGRQKGWSPAAPSRRLRWLGRAAVGSLVLVSLPPMVLLLLSLKTDIPQGFGMTYRQTCSQCHSEQRPLSYLHSPEAWALTIERHRRLAPERFTDATAAASLQYLTAKRSASGADLFRYKCLVCHAESTIREPRPAEEWQRIVNRTARFNTFLLSPMEERELTRYIGSTPLVAAAPANAENSASKKLFERACSQCHTLDIALLPDIPDARWPSILSRMAAKAPAVITEDEARSLESWILAMRRDPERFKHAVPHHSPKLFFGGTSR